MVEWCWSFWGYGAFRTRGGEGTLETEAISKTAFKHDVCVQTIGKSDLSISKKTTHLNQLLQRE